MATDDPTLTTASRGSSPPEKRSPTRELLLWAAERLFALNGTEAVSLIEIQEAAGQRNASAIHYHFGGGREALIRGIVDLRAVELNGRRMALLDALEEQGLTGDVVSLADALVRPLAEQVQAGSYYIGFLARITARVPTERPAPLLRDPANASLARVGWMLRDCVPHVPRRVLRSRVELASDLAIHALAMHQTAHGQEVENLPRLERVIDDLVDGLSGFLSAPSRRKGEFDGGPQSRAGAVGAGTGS
jgi:AcrR family transcriptional regulator